MDDMMKNKNILITGGLGFIGSHLSNRLIQNNNVTIIDNLSTGKLDNLEKINHENLTLIKKDLNSIDLNSALTDIEYVFHLAAMSSVPLSIKQPISCNMDNVTSTINLLNACIHNNIKKIIFSSSSSVYGQNTNIPLKETEMPMPTSPYAASKASCELYLQAFHESYGLNYIALRYFNTFGPKQNKNSQYAAVIPNFIDALLKNEQAEIYGDGEQTRDFIYVEDVVKANINAAKSNYNGIINIASGKSISINQLYEIIQKTLDVNIEPKYVSPRLGDITHSHANIEQMKNINLKINNNNFEKNLIETINWFKEDLDI